MLDDVLKIITDKNNPYFELNCIGINNAIPTTGTYNVGDIIISSTQENSIYGWICVVAGSPGTWIELIQMDHTHNYASSSSEGGTADSANKLDTAVSITIGNTQKSFDGSTDLTWTLDEIGLSTGEHYHPRFIGNYNVSTIPVTLANGEVRFDSRVNKGTTDLFPHTNYANAILSINKHTGAYNSQLGFSGNGNIYYRNSSATGTAWKQIAFAPGDYCVSLASGTDLNTITKSGTYRGSGWKNTPDTTGDQFYMEVINKDATNQYVYQRVTKLNSGYQELFDRFMRGGTWYPWRTL